MQSINFEILRQDRPALASLGGFAEQYAHIDPAGALVKLQTFGEQLDQSKISQVVQSRRLWSQGERIGNAGTI
jgi:hypothetical protein